MRKETYLKIWFHDFGGIWMHELRQIFSDWGVMLIFFVDFINASNTKPFSMQRI